MAVGNIQDFSHRRRRAANCQGCGRICHGNPKNLGRPGASRPLQPRASRPWNEKRRRRGNPVACAFRVPFFTRVRVLLDAHGFRVHDAAKAVVVFETCRSGSPTSRFEREHLVVRGGTATDPCSIFQRFRARFIGNAQADGHVVGDMVRPHDRQHARACVGSCLSPVNNVNRSWPPTPCRSPTAAPGAGAPTWSTAQRRGETADCDVRHIERHVFVDAFDRCSAIVSARP